nr:hypothetical protein [Parachlamydiaceae bacterium]
VPAGQRLFVVESDFYGRGWGWIKDYPGKIDPSEWHTKEPVALAALYDIPRPKTVND